MSGDLTSSVIEAAPQSRASVEMTNPPQANAPAPKGIVLAGMHAWGECMLEEVLTRPLWPIAGQPLISHVLGWLERAGVRQTSICGNGHTHHLFQVVGCDHYNTLGVDYYEDRMPRGPAGCVRDAALRGDESQFLVIDGTVIPAINLSDMMQKHRQSRAVLTMAVTKTGSMDDPAGCETLEPVGVYLFEREALNLVPSAGYQDIKESLIPRLRAEGLNVAVYEVDCRWTPRVRCPSSYLAVNRWYLDRLSQDDGRDSIERFGWVAADADIDKSARLVGPVHVGAKARIGPGALIVGPTSIGSGCQVESGATVARSALWDGSRVGAGTVVDHCILTGDAILEDGLELRDSVLIPVTGRIRWWRRWLGATQKNGVNAVSFGP